MNKVFASDVKSTQLLLRIILNNDKIKVKTVNTQQFIQNLYGHSAQLDILATDENGRRFNVEIQRDDEGAPVKRAKEAVQKTAQARNIELAKDLLSEGETIERTVRLSKLSEAEVRELASKLTA